MREIIGWGAWGTLMLALAVAFGFCVYSTISVVKEREWGFVPLFAFLGVLSVLLFLQGFVVAGLAH